MTPAAFPTELRALPQWVLWRYEVRKGKRTKIPYQTDGRPASSTNPGTWTEYAAAYDAWYAGLATKRAYDGIGFVFSADDPYCGVDLDHFLDRGGAVQDRAIDIIDALGSYTEYSPSGTGAHVIVRTQLPAGFTRQPGTVECYEHGRYFTVTGDQVGGTPDDVVAWDGDGLVKVLFPDGQPRRVQLQPVRRESSAPVLLDDDALLDKAMRAKHGDRFGDLWQGGISAYSSHSEADMALACRLAFWTNGDAERMDALFRRSGLMRDKWNERAGYRARTIARAIALVGAGYEPARRGA